MFVLLGTIFCISLLAAGYFYISHRRNIQTLPEEQQEVVETEPTPAPEPEPQLATEETPPTPEPQKQTSNPKPVCMYCGHDMIWSGQASLPTAYFDMFVPLEQYLCPSCGGTLRYMHTLNADSTNANKMRFYCFWSHPEKKREFNERVSEAVGRA